MHAQCKAEPDRRARRGQAGEGEASGDGALEAAAGAPQPEGPGGSLPGLAELMFLELVPQVRLQHCMRVPGRHVMHCRWGSLSGLAESVLLGVMFKFHVVVVTRQPVFASGL